MKKSLLFLFIIGLTFSACHDDIYDDPAGNVDSPVQKVECVNPAFVRLLDDSTNVAGILRFTGSGESATIRWNVTPKSNLDTLQVTVPLIDGQGRLPIKWRRKLQEGTYGPKSTTFTSGVMITSGNESRYVPLVWAARLDSAKFLKSISSMTRADDVSDPKASELSFFPSPVRLSGANPKAGWTQLRITDKSMVFVDYSDILPGDKLKLDDTDTPSLVEGLEKQMLNFYWSSAAPARGFTRTVFAASENSATAEVDLIYKLVQEPELIVDSDTIRVNSKGGKAVAAVNISTNTDTWDATCNSTWLHPDILTGIIGISTITLDVDENPIAGERMSSIDISADGGNLTKRVVVVQEAAIPSLVVLPGSVTLESVGGESIESIVVTTNLAQWTATSSQPWLTISPTSGVEGSESIILSATSNTTTASRVATITVKAGNLTQLITVTQKGITPSLEIESLSVELAAEGGSDLSPLNVITNLPEWNAVSNSAWLIVTPVKGNTGTTKISFNAESNPTTKPRTANVTITAGTVTKVIVVTQAGLVPYLNVSTNAITAPAPAGNLEATVSSNASWSASSDQGWLTVGTSSWNKGDNVSLNLSVSENTGDTRTATVTITSGDLSKTIVVTQEAGKQSVDSGNVDIEDLDNQQSGEVNGGEL